MGIPVEVPINEEPEVDDISPIIQTFLATHPNMDEISRTNITAISYGIENINQMFNLLLILETASKYHYVKSLQTKYAELFNRETKEQLKESVETTDIEAWYKGMRENILMTAIYVGNYQQRNYYLSKDRRDFIEWVRIIQQNGEYTSDILNNMLIMVASYDKIILTINEIESLDDDSEEKTKKNAILKRIQSHESLTDAIELFCTLTA